ncbi:hypothetical protein SAMN06265222_11069 [Neorhodopirellula lusitana]|uniref:Uncharacterized protein n=1 Tax=Neorhodopirellula lusitana TaxID=445327 RepID=A0ABY1QEI6_9BACT|nr:hypothetical protein SAMN06265222_11069 [Neorhodopirellula lusitana]
MPNKTIPQSLPIYPEVGGEIRLKQDPEGD